MATAKEKSENPKTLDVSKMSIYEKLQAVRNEFYEVGAKKTGKNPRAECLYFQLTDIVPIAQPLFTKYNLFMYTTFKGGTATAYIVNMDDPTQIAPFDIPWVEIAEPGKFRMNEVQGVGAAVTYYRRYLYMIVLDLVEKDEIEEAPKEKPERKKPASPEKRKEIKDQLTGEENAPATEEEVKALKNILKELLNVDPAQEEFVNDIAVKTEGFKVINKGQCSALIEGVTAMLNEYGEAD